MGILYIVATPIGNLKDITFHAIEILKNVDLVICEDTRHTKKLLDYYNIQKPTVSYHQHSNLQKVNYILEELKRGKIAAFVSDAGTPGISDPGNKLVALAVKNGIQVFPIPGPTAVIVALSVSGFPTDSFVFYGFMPHKKGKETLMKKIAENEVVSVFYESTHRIMKTLERMKNFLEPQRQIVVCRELTKKFETIYRGNINEVLETLQKDKVLGEFVVIVDRRL